MQKSPSWDLYNQQNKFGHFHGEEMMATSMNHGGQSHMVVVVDMVGSTTVHPSVVVATTNTVFSHQKQLLASNSNPPSHIRLVPTHLVFQ